MVNLCREKFGPVCFLIFAIYLWKVALPAFAIDTKSNMNMDMEDKYAKILFLLQKMMHMKKVRVAI